MESLSGGWFEFLTHFFSSPFQFLGEDLVTVLDQLRIKYVIALGDGAGANIVARFAMMHAQR